MFTSIYMGMFDKKKEDISNIWLWRKTYTFDINALKKNIDEILRSLRNLKMKHIFRFRSNLEETAFL